MVGIEIFAFGANAFTELGVKLEGLVADTEGIFRIGGFFFKILWIVTSTPSFLIFSQIIFAGAGRVVLLNGEDGSFNRSFRTTRTLIAP